MQTNHETAVKATYFSIISNIALAITKGTAGYFGNSYALIADAIESTADIFSSSLVLLGLKYTNRPADKNHPYGHGRAEPLVTFIVVGFLITSATVIAYESIQNIGTPHKGPKAWTLLFLIALIAWKEISFRKVMKKAVETKSSSLKADAWHHRSDAVTSVAAFLGISIALIFGEGYENADDWAALFAAGFILYNSYKIFRPALGEIMDEDTHYELVAEIRHESLKVASVLGTEKCLIRKTGMQYHVDLHIIVDGSLTVYEGHKISHLLKDALVEKMPDLGNVLIHVEPERQDNQKESHHRS
ncbi:cation diffusion facilitator family transporter [Flavobacterium sp. NRK1]|uniref:cation diffusion facilitator family transporter n=1 Tax=Flavobacterium sp. NRK1 TaxID=2954929 RepID=UPI002093345D|nr:cation diffusion facilitator family transporter [Flavobacterium sp. NRK1]MCO6148916.1 cation diffusion facilitator family transporter [Flavobacterium sp. NRK1]